MKERLRQQGNPCLRELRKKFTSGASTRQTSTIKLGITLKSSALMYKKPIRLPLHKLHAHSVLYSNKLSTRRALEKSSCFQGLGLEQGAACHPPDPH